MARFAPILYRLLPGKTLLLALLVLLLQAGSLMAQCSRIGRVASVTTGCGAVIKELTNGQFFHAVGSEAEALVSGKTILFGIASGLPTSGCTQDGLPTFSLACSTDLLTEAHFSYSASPDNPLKYIFKAEGYGGITQICQWSFGDGIVSSQTDSIAEHAFLQPGVHTVCLQVISGLDVIAQACQEVLVGGQSTALCGYDTYVTAVGTQLYAKLLPQNSSVGQLTSISWTNGNNGPMLGDNPSLSTQLPDYGTYTICVAYTVKDTVTNSLCTGSICKTLTATEPGCANAQLIATVQVCPDMEVPVCGCDNQTYANECEALAAGITTWWAGDCNSIYGSCLADLEMKILNGSPDMGYQVQFKNLSGGNFNMSHLDFGDGSPIMEASSWNTIVYHYEHGGVYPVSLSTWKQNACASTVTKLLVTDAFNLTTENLPDAPDYVLPGDANGDKKANVYDLLDIGVGYLTSGAPRPNASSDWVPQFAANWPDQLPETLNFKHFDCDGDGMVLDLDADLIEPHYSPIDSTELLPVPGAPTIKVEFAQDTIFVDANNPAPLEIMADVVVGNYDAPALDLHGLAFALKYPEYVEHDPVVDYKNDFFGISNHILWLPKDNYNRRQLDLGFTEKYESASGYGRIATITFRTDFIIIIDIIDREIGDTKAFAVPIRGLKAIDAEGHELYFGTPAVQDTLWIKLLETSGTHDQALDEQVTVYPNPATEEVRILTGDLEMEHLEAVNPLGQVVYSTAPAPGRVQRLQVTDWPTGLYTVRLQTKQGLVVKKLTVQ